MKTSSEWSEYQRMVLHRLDRTDGELRDIKNELKILSGLVTKHGERLTMTAAVYGFLAGSIPAILVVAFDV